MRSGRGCAPRSREGNGGKEWDVSVEMNRDECLCKKNTTSRQQRQYPQKSAGMCLVLKQELPNATQKSLICSFKKQIKVSVLTDILLVLLALSGHRLVRSAAAVLRASTQAVRHAVHLLQRLKPAHMWEWDSACGLCQITRKHHYNLGFQIHYTLCYIIYLYIMLKVVTIRQK